MAEPYKMPAPGKIAGAFDVAKGAYNIPPNFYGEGDLSVYSSILGICGEVGAFQAGGRYWQANGYGVYGAYGYGNDARRVPNYPLNYVQSDFVLSYNTTRVTFTGTQALYQIGIGTDGRLYLGTQIMGDVFSSLYPNACVGSSISGAKLSDTVPRTVSNYGLWTYQTAGASTLYDRSGNVQSVFNSEWQLYFPLHMVWRGKNSEGGSLSYFGSSSLFTIALANAMNIPIYALINSAVDYSGRAIEPAITSVIADTFSLFRVPSELKKAANAAQIPCAINDNAAIQNVVDPRDLPDYTPPGQPDNPTGGGDGDGDNDSDPLEIPDDPELTPINTGVGLWAFDANECDLVAKFLWAPKSFLGGIAGTDADVTRAWVNAFYLPFDIVSHDPSHVALARVYTGSYDTELDANSILPGYTTSFDLGTIDVIEYYGSFLDYPPYTSIYIYLPYIGYKQLDVSKIMRKRINVTYHVDLAIGTCTAIVSYIADNSRVPFAMFTGQMGIPIQVSGLNTGVAMTASVQAAFQTAAIVGAAIPAVAMGGGAIGAAAAMLGGANISTGAQAANVIGNIENAGAKHQTEGTIKADAVSIGTAGGQSWLTCPQGAFLIISRAITATPNNFAELNGWATRYTGKVSEFTGFLSCSQVENTIAATDTEIAAINSMLQSGIYI